MVWIFLALTEVLGLTLPALVEVPEQMFLVTLKVLEQAFPEPTKILKPGPMFPIPEKAFSWNPAWLFSCLEPVFHVAAPSFEMQSMFSF